MSAGRARVSTITISAVLLALALVLGLLENQILSFISLSIPGIRLGIANLTVLTAIYVLGIYPALFIGVGKGLLIGVFSGSLSTSLFSITGTVLAIIGMYLMKRYSNRVFGIVGVSIVGAVLHSVGQIVIAVLITTTPGLYYYLPILSITSVITGSLIGIISKGVIIRIYPLVSKGENIDKYL